MLVKLTIKNYVLIEQLEMKPSEALTIITGETGAGKSIMLGAVGLLMGNRADTKALLHADKKCVIEGVFGISEYGMKPLFEENDIDYDDQTIIRREISATGKSRAFVNDTPVRLEFLKELSEGLLDVHSQHETFDLAQQFYQIKLLDSYAGNEALKISYQTAFFEYEEARKRYEQLLLEAEKIRKDQDYNQFLYQELEDLGLSEDEQETLEQELQILEHTEEIKLQLNQSSEILSGIDSSVLSVLSEVRENLQKISGYSTKLNELSERINSNYIDLEDLHKEIDQENESLEYDEQKATSLSARLSEVYRLQQKHKVISISELIEIQESLSTKLSTALNLEDDLKQLEEQCSLSLNNTMVLGKQLSGRRQDTASKLCEDVCKILDNLSIPEASMNVDFKENPPTVSGIDRVSFTFSANKGVSPEPIQKVASGGEYSRLMFAIKYIMAGKTSLPTIIFDEIDNGISGEVAKKLGLLMKEMGSKHQIIAITHLPQIAAKGTRHFFVYKETGEESTASQIRELSREERIDEIAKMIAGDNPSSSALESARELVS